MDSADVAVVSAGAVEADYLGGIIDHPSWDVDRDFRQGAVRFFRDVSVGKFLGTGGGGDVGECHGGESSVDGEDQSLSISGGEFGDDRSDSLADRVGGDHGGITKVWRWMDVGLFGLFGGVFDGGGLCDLELWSASAGWIPCIGLSECGDVGSGGGELVGLARDAFDGAGVRWMSNGGGVDRDASRAIALPLEGEEGTGSGGLEVVIDADIEDGGSARGWRAPGETFGFGEGLGAVEGVGGVEEIDGKFFLNGEDLVGEGMRVDLIA